MWANVKAQQGKLSENTGTRVNNDLSPTSLQLAMENDKVQSEVAKFRAAITAKVGDRGGVVGFVTVVNGQVTGAEAFASHAIFKKAWAKAMNAAAVEAVAAKPNATFTAMTPAGVRSFLARAGDEAKESVLAKAEPVGSPDGMVRELSMTTFDSTPQRGRSNVTRVRALQSGGGTNDVITEVNALIEASPAIPSPTPLNPSDPARVNLGRSVQNRGRPVVNDVRTGYSAPTPGTANTAVVEYREPGKGAVIHKSFLVK